MSSTTTPSLYEVITVALADEFRDGEVGFTGLTTGPQAVRYGTSMPLAAMALAREKHAPNLSILLAGWAVNPDLRALRRLPDLEFDSELVNLPAEAHITGYPNAIGYKTGSVSFGFSSGAQVDRYGNLNSTEVAGGANGRVRLVGPILLPLHFTHFGREYVMMPRHDRRTFVESVDYRSGVGHRVGARSRADLELPASGIGAALVVSPLGFFDFDGPDNSMRARSIHPGVDKSQVADATGFEIAGLDEAPTTPLPTAEDLELLRAKVDPARLLVPDHSNDN